MTIRRFGDPLTPIDTDVVLVPALPAGQTVQPPVQVRRWVRNGKHPNAEYESLKNEALNQAALFRTKDYCAFPAPLLQPNPTSSAPYDRWRFAFRSGPLAHSAMIRCLMWSPTGYPGSAYCDLKLFSDADEATTVSTTEFHYGPLVSSVPSWDLLRVVDRFVDITPNTDYYALVREVNGASAGGFTMFELASMTEVWSGYLPQNLGAQGPILDKYREHQRKLARALWQGSAPKVFHWTTNPGNYAHGHGGGPDFTYKPAPTTPAENILDLTSTAPSSSTPGIHPDMRWKKTLRQAGVPCIMKAFGKTGSNPDAGRVKIVDDSGATIAEIDNAWNTTPGWREVAFEFPETHDRYDIMFDCGSAANDTEFFLWAVSIYESEEYEPEEDEVIYHYEVTNIDLLGSPGEQINETLTVPVGKRAIAILTGNLEATPTSAGDEQELQLGFTYFEGKTTYASIDVKQAAKVDDLGHRHSAAGQATWIGDGAPHTISVSAAVAGDAPSAATLTSLNLTIIIGDNRQ